MKEKQRKEKAMQKININMRCIEMMEHQSQQHSLPLININMRCIEIKTV